MARNQRERLVAAMAEACAEKGYAGASVADVAKRAGGEAPGGDRFRSCPAGGGSAVGALLTVEILAAGPEGTKRHDEMVEALVAGGRAPPPRALRRHANRGAGI